VHRRSIGTRGSYTDKPGIAVYLAISCPRWHNTGAIKQARRFDNPTRHPKRSSSRFGTQLSLYTVSTRSPRACGPVDVDPNGNDRRGYSMHVGHVGKFGKFAAKKDVGSAYQLLAIRRNLNHFHYNACPAGRNLRVVHRPRGRFQFLAKRDR
jgi:hypothetical protein